MATRVQALRSGVRIPVREIDFSLLQKAQTGSEAHKASYSMGTAVHFWDKAARA